MLESRKLQISGGIIATSAIVGTGISAALRRRRRTQQLGYEDQTADDQPALAEYTRYANWPLQRRLKLFELEEDGEPNLVTRVQAFIHHSAVSSGENTVLLPALLERIRGDDMRLVGSAIGKLLAARFVIKASLLSDPEVVGLTSTADGIQAEGESHALQVAVSEIAMSQAGDINRY